MNLDKRFIIHSNSLEPKAGNILISEPLMNDFHFGRSVILLIDHEEAEGSFGVIIETPGFLNEFSGYQNLKMLASLRRSVQKDEIMNMLRMVSLEENARKKVRSYSLGMRQRLGIAQALIDNPPVLLLDEPFNALDEKSRHQVYRLLGQEKENGKIIILSSHHPYEIRDLCDEVYTFRDHKICKQ